MILVTGSTGTVGTSLVAALSSAGHPVRALAQEGETVPPGWPDDVEVVVADLGDRSSLVDAIAGVDATGTDDLPGLIGRPAHSLDDFLAVNAAAIRAAERVP